MPTTTELAEKYISGHPSTKDCLAKGIVNYSKLSRKIAKELGIEKKTSMEAILIACRRYSAKLKPDKGFEARIIALLKKSEIEIKNKIVVAIISKKTYGENLTNIEKRVRKTADTLYTMEGTSVFTVVTSEKYLDDLNLLFKHHIIKMSKNLAIIKIKSPEQLETTPGVMAYVYSLFAENGVNILETMSCWTDTVFVIDEKDISKVMEFIKFD